MTSTLRLPQIDLKAVLSQEHPSIDLRVHTYENSTRNFLKALTSYKNRAITTISERRKHQALEKKKVLERTQAVEAETNQCKLREVDLVARESLQRALVRLLSQLEQSLNAKRRKGRMQSYPWPHSSGNWRLCGTRSRPLTWISSNIASSPRTSSAVRHLVFPVVRLLKDAYRKEQGTGDAKNTRIATGRTEYM